MGEGTDEEERNTEQNGMDGSCPTHGWVGTHELFGELEKREVCQWSEMV